MTKDIKARPIPDAWECDENQLESALALFIADYQPDKVSFARQFREALQSAANQIAREAVEDYLQEMDRQRYVLVKMKETSD